MTGLMRFVPLMFVELAARTAGYLVGIARPALSYGAERRVRGFYWSLRFRAKKLLIGRHVQFEGTNFRIGDNVRLYDGGHYVATGGGYVHIGKGTHVSRQSIISGLGGVEIGEGCGISAHVAIYSVTADTGALMISEAVNYKGRVVIGNNVYIGASAVIIPGVTVGDNVVIAAGAVVTRDIPPDMLAKGVPATFSPNLKRAARLAEP